MKPWTYLSPSHIAAHVSTAMLDFVMGLLHESILGFKMLKGHLWGKKLS